MNNLAYKNSAYDIGNIPTKSERSIEYQAFAKVTRSLSLYGSDAKKNFQDLCGSIHENRRLWTILATDVMSDENPLPLNLRADIFSLSQFVSKHSKKVLDGSETCDALVEINKSIMRGLCP